MRTIENWMVPALDETLELEEASPDSGIPRRLHESIRRAPRRARRAWIHREIRRSIHRIAE